MTDPVVPLPDPDARYARVLVVDDSESVRAAMREVLEAELKAEVLEAENGSAALEVALSDQDLDCVLCDIRMPQMDGLVFLRMLRAQRSRLEIPVLMVTVKDDVATKLECFKGGASDFVSKPFNHDELIARVETQTIVRRMYKRTARLTERLKVLTETDALTGLKNRRAFMRLLAAESGRARRTKRPVGLLIIDVDHFKSINDQHGHPTGDRVLAEVANRLSEEARGYDTIARIGGEEFAVLLPEVSEDNAVIVAERLRGAVEATRSAGELELGVTISIGLAMGPIDGDEVGEALFQLADTALYEAKGAGRNRVAKAS
jgi:diguanylate cyclase (GGDEF)-like protein